MTVIDAVSAAGACQAGRAGAPVLQVVHRVTTRHLLGQAGLEAGEADSGAPR
jgi:hypothetical protein